jgi:hypothetical protein
LCRQRRFDASDAVPRSRHGTLNAPPCGGHTRSRDAALVICKLVLGGVLITVLGLVL